MACMKLRAHLLGLMLAIVVPMGLFAAIAIAVHVERERDAFRQGAEARVLAVLSALDNKLDSSISALHALATSHNLDNGNLAGFREDAMRVLASEPEWINVHLARTDGQQVLNLRRAATEPLTRIVDMESVERLLHTRRPAVGALTEGQLRRGPLLPVRVPVVREGEIAYVLTALVKPAALASVLHQQSLPGDWIGVAFDRNDRIITRTLRGEQTTGQPISQHLRDALARAPSGWSLGETLEGQPTYAAHRRSALTGIGVAIGIPPSAVNAGAYRAAWTMGLAMLFALAIAGLLAIYFGRRIERPIAQLAQATDALRRGEPFVVPRDASFAELQTLSSGIDAAAHALRERQALLEREKAALEAADRAKNEFLAMLSHELRNPLAGLAAASHVLRIARPESEEAGHARGVIERQTRHITRLIEDLLDVSGVIMGRISLKRERFDLAQAVAGALDVWRASGRLARHQVALEAAPVWIHADRARVEQIVGNLLDNALKFTPEGGRIQLLVKPERDKGLLEVRDAGQGIAPELIGRVFDLFVQGEHGLDRGKGGMGIGLALVKRLAELHGGSVSVASEGVGRGARFVVLLPAAGPPNVRQVSEEAAPAPGRYRILLIEDNEDARRALRRALELEGHEVEEAADGVQGLALAERGAPEVVVVDIGLPGMNGYEIARRLRARSEAAMALIALTGYGQAEDVRRAREAGFQAHVTKPVDVATLQKIIAGTKETLAEARP
jgi:signal transduction histidine kinase/ActR/RegA family two-component response regulator